jgi:hypothetical protein
MHIKKKHGKGHFNAAKDKRIKEITLGHGDLILQKESTDLRKTVIRLATRL